MWERASSSRRCGLRPKVARHLGSADSSKEQGSLENFSTEQTHKGCPRMKEGQHDSQKSGETADEQIKA